MASSQQQQELILEQFQMFDIDGGGFITPSELSSILKTLNGEAFSDDKVEIMFNAMDASGDGRVTIKEFIAWLWGGSAEVVQLAQEDLAKELSSLQAFTDQYAQDTSAKFLGKVPRPPAVSFQEFCEQHKLTYEELLHDEVEDEEYCGRYETKVVRSALSNHEVGKRKENDFAEYIKSEKALLKSQPMVLMPVSFTEYKPGERTAGECIALAEDLMRFMTKGGFVPSGLEQHLLARTSLVDAWKTQAAKYQGALLLPQAGPGRNREAVYKLLSVDNKSAYVGKLPGVKWKPPLLAESDGNGGWTLPLNDAQKHFDLMKPSQLSRCANNLARELAMFNSCFENPV